MFFLLTKKMGNLCSTGSKDQIGEPPVGTIARKPVMVSDLKDLQDLQPSSDMQGTAVSK